MLRLILLVSSLAVVPPRQPPRDAWFGTDKLKHFFIAAFTQSVAYSGLRLVGASHGAALAGATGAAVTVSLGKEFYDKPRTGLFSGRDLAWDAVGVGTASLMLRHTRRER